MNIHNRNKRRASQRIAQRLQDATCLFCGKHVAEGRDGLKHHVQRTGVSEFETRCFWQRDLGQMTQCCRSCQDRWHNDLRKLWQAMTGSRPKITRAEVMAYGDVLIHFNWGRNLYQDGPGYARLIDELGKRLGAAAAAPNSFFHVQLRNSVPSAAHFIVV